MSVEKAGVILCPAEERLVVSLMMWLQSHHDVSCMKMLSYRNAINVLADEADTSAGILLRDRLEEMIIHTGASLIVVVDARSWMGDQGVTTGKGGRLSAARRRAQSWFPDIAVIGLSFDDRLRVLSEPELLDKKRLPV